MTWKRVSLQNACIMVAALFALLPNTAQGDDQSDLRAMMADMQVRMANLENENARLRTNQNDTWLSECRANDIKALVNEVLADAESRISLQSDGLTAGHNGSFFIASPDGNFLMKPGGWIAVRYLWNSRDDSTHSGNVEGFDIGAAKLWFKGHIYDPALRYKFVLKTSSGDILLDDAYIENDIADGWTLRIGKFYAPFLYEQLVSSMRQHGITRTPVNSAFTVGKIEGIQLAYKNDCYNARVMIHDGTDGDDDETDFAIVARVEYLVAGTFKQFSDSATWSGDETALIIGAAVNWELGQPDPGVALADDYNLFAWTLDAATEFEGFTLQGSVVAHEYNFNDATPDYDMYGYTIQGSYAIIPDKADIFVTYSYLDLQETAAADNIGIITFGSNWYMHKNNARVTIDVAIALDPITSDVDDLDATTTGFEVSDDDNQIAIRGQYQVIY